MRRIIRVIGPIARATLLEAARSRMIWLVAILCLLCLGLAGFIQQVAIIEAPQIQATVLAAILRAAAAFLTAAFVTMSLVREYNDKVFELMLAQPWPRGVYLAGKFVGFSTAAVALAVIVSLPLLPFVPLDRLGAWTLSLGCELIIVAAMSLFCVITLAHVVPALATVLGFYVLARSIAAMQVIAAGSETPGTWAERAADWVIRGIALVLPRLDLMTRSDWLVAAMPAPAVLAGVVGQAVTYAVLLMAAAQFDLHRQNF
jgi:ABC-type transport system involved in multi-copper enzyme maturation permease subunit